MPGAQGVQIEDVDLPDSLDPGASATARIDMTNTSNFINPWNANRCNEGNNYGLLVEGVLEDQASLGAAGVDELRWKQPVFPGDTLRVETTTLAKEDWQPGVGLVRSQTRTLNQDDREVCSFVGLVLYEKRE